MDEVAGSCLWLSSGRRVDAEARGWCGPLTPEDHDVLDRSRAPVLDIGCGPGRHVLGLVERGKVALGIDLTAPAVALARRRGAPVLHRSVFARVPAAGRWQTALLLDGNIGIGGDPVVLLRRVAALVAADGSVLVELCAGAVTPKAMQARLELAGVTGPWFPWTNVAVGEIGRVAETSGLSVSELWRSGSRWFGQLRRDARRAAS